jgi:hypothetical protein
MAEKIVHALCVRLESPAPSGNGLSQDWSSEKVQNLVVLPDSGLARCVIKGSTYCAKFAWYRPDAQSQTEWEVGGSYHCDVCGQDFQNLSGLKGHIVAKHPQLKGK